MCTVQCFLFKFHGLWVNTSNLYICTERSDHSPVLDTYVSAHPTVPPVSLPCHTMLTLHHPHPHSLWYTSEIRKRICHLDRQSPTAGNLHNPFAITFSPSPTPLALLFPVFLFSASSMYLLHPPSPPHQMAAYKLSYLFRSPFPFPIKYSCKAQ